jgi:glycosyltransferase involved in cell wall biosynthesis
MGHPLLSIVIANYNYGRFLEEAIESVVAQNMGNKVELIICDAASTDNSIDIIRKHADGLPPNTSYSDWILSNNSRPANNSSRLITWWCSEKDGGQSAAFNKGFAHAKGEWLTWLNADDLLLPGALKKFEGLVVQKPNAVWVTGNMLSFDSNSNTIVQVNWGPHTQPPFLDRGRAFSAVFGPTAFWRRSLYEEVGPIDEHLHYAMDTDYWARLTMFGIRQTRLNHFCWGFRLHDDSKTEGAQTDKVADRRKYETAYWREKTKYNFVKSLINPWYLTWCIWRIVDGSWLMRLCKKHKFEGRNLSVAFSAPKKADYKIRIFEPTVPEYRVALFEGLAERLPGRIEIVTADSNSYKVKGAKCDFGHERIAIGPMTIYKGLSLDGLSKGDVITVDGSPKALSPMGIALIAKLKGIRVVWWGHHLSAQPKWYRVKIRLWLAKMLADIFLCYTDDGIKFLVENGFRRDRVFATGNTIDTKSVQKLIEKYSNGNDIVKFKQDKGLEGRFVLLFCGRLRALTGLEVLIQALQNLKKMGRLVKCVVIGAGKEMDSLKELAKTQEVDDMILWTGELRGQERLALWFLSSDVFTYPGRVGLSVIHAMSYGLPVILNDNQQDHGPEYSVFRPGENGWAFHAGSSKDLTDAIVRAMDSPSRVVFGANGRRRVVESYSIERMVERFLEAVDAAAKV